MGVGDNGTRTEPLVLFVPDQPPEAMQEVTFEDVHARVTFKNTPAGSGDVETDNGPSELFAVIFTVGFKLQTFEAEN